MCTVFIKLYEGLGTRDIDYGLGESSIKTVVILVKEGVEKCGGGRVLLNTTGKGMGEQIIFLP